MVATTLNLNSKRNKRIQQKLKKIKDEILDSTILDLFPAEYDYYSDSNPDLNFKIIAQTKIVKEVKITKRM